MATASTMTTQDYRLRGVQLRSLERARIAVAREKANNGKFKTLEGFLSAALDIGVVALAKQLKGAANGD